jgi:4-hydroxy-tetrahydrodipicolinate reductase
MNIIVSGILGRMGRTVCEAAADAADMRVVYGIDAAADSPETVTAGGVDIPVSGSWEAVTVAADAIIDFSHYTAVPALLHYAVAKTLPVVVCTTGLGEDEQGAMRDAARKVPVFNSANMSLGIGVVKSMARLAVPALERDFNMEIIEAHHKMKKDSPSGTAIMLADAMNEMCETRKDYVYGRHGKSDEVKMTDLGVHAVRGGTIPGKHTILFAGPGETIEITHTAYTRDIFALGAIKAARYIADKQPGLYTMDDLL